MHLVFYIFALLALLLSPLSATEIDKLLERYSVRNDSSTQTINANRGHLLLFSRSRIEQIHAKTLKDIMLTTPVIYYHENRYAIPDYIAGGTTLPFSSNFVKIYVDDVEITQGWLGGGIVLYGDMDIGFVDHIELYYTIPSVETSSEAAFLSIFLYSKDPDKDSGTSLSLLQKDNGYATQSILYGGRTDTVSYMAYLSHTQAIQNKIENGTPTPLSRDFGRTQFFGYVKGEKQMLHLQVLQKDADSLAGMSFDATPIESHAKNTNIHLDYSIDFDAHWRGVFAYDHLESSHRYSDDKPQIGFAGYSLSPLVYHGGFRSSTYTAKIRYRKHIGEHRITTGAKLRYLKLDDYHIEALPDFRAHFNKELTASLFWQDQYRLDDKQLLSFGLSYSHIERNADIYDSDLWQSRLGYTCSGALWHYKAFLFRNMYAEDPLYISLKTTPSSDKQQSILGFTQEIGYHTDKYNLSLITLATKDTNSLFSRKQDKDVEYYFAALKLGYKINQNNKIYASLDYTKYYNLFDIDMLAGWDGYLSLYSSYKSLEMHHGLIWHKNSIDDTHYFDLSSSITWNATEDLSLTLKGENLLNRSKTTQLPRIDTGTMTPMDPLSIPSSDRRVSLELEYHF